MAHGSIRALVIEVPKSGVDEIHGSLLYERYRSSVERSMSQVTLAIDEACETGPDGVLELIRAVEDDDIICEVEERRGVLQSSWTEVSVVCGRTERLKQLTLAAGIERSFPFSGGVSFFSSAIRNEGARVHLPLGGGAS